MGGQACRQVQLTEGLDGGGRKQEVGHELEDLNFGSECQFKVIK